MSVRQLRRTRNDPGLLVVMASGGVMTGMFQSARDVHRGVTDRLRTLPVSRAAVPVGQAAADVVVTAAGTVPFLLVGLAVGRRVEGGAPEAVGAVALLLPFRFACGWTGIFLGLLTRNEEAAGRPGGAAFLLPLLSSACAPAEGLPDGLRTVAERNPISAVATAPRDLFGNAPVPGGAAWPVAHPVAGSPGRCAVLLVVFVPLAVRRAAGTEGAGGPPARCRVGSGGADRGRARARSAPAAPACRGDDGRGRGAAPGRRNRPGAGATGCRTGSGADDAAGRRARHGSPVPARPWLRGRARCHAR
ncbi:hypothetical protein SUDANB126_05595 [Streptomyces sp. enrichment culture]